MGSIWQALSQVRETRRSAEPPSFRVGFDAAYRGVPPPWDIGRPQPVFAHLAASGALSGRVLDVGCGTGEHAIMAAAIGLDATGVDLSPTAIRLAIAKAAARGVSARFLVADALALPTLGETFDTVLDCGFFHVLTDDERVRFAAALRQVMNLGGRYHLLCFSDRMPGTVGPRRVSQAEIRATFGEAWRVDDVEAATIETTDPGRVAIAWHATMSAR